MIIDYDPVLDMLLVSGAAEHGDEISKPLLECVRKAIATEREACERIAQFEVFNDKGDVARKIASSIRSRSQKGEGK